MTYLNKTPLEQGDGKVMISGERIKDRDRDWGKICVECVLGLAVEIKLK